MSVTAQLSYEELEKTVEEYVDGEYSLKVDDSEEVSQLVIDSEDDIFDQLIIVGNELGSQNVAYSRDSSEYRLSLDNSF